MAMSRVPSAVAAGSSPVDCFRVWLFVDRDVFSRATDLDGVGLETEWARLWLAAVECGDAWGPTWRQPDGAVRVSFELEILRPSSRGPRTWPLSVESACGSHPPSGGLRLVIGGIQEGSVVLFVTQKLLRRGTQFGDSDLETAWARLWVVAVARSAVVEDAPQPTVRMQVVLPSSI